MAGDFLKRKAEEQAKIIDEKYGEGKYGGTAYLKSKIEEAKKTSATEKSSSTKSGGAKTDKSTGKTGDWLKNKAAESSALSTGNSYNSPNNIPAMQKEEQGGNKDSWFKTGALYDGYDFGDVTKTVLGTGWDFGMNVKKGIGRMAEGLVDLGTYGIAGVADLFGADEFAKKAKDVARYSATDEWTKGATDFVDKYSVLGNKADAIAEGLGQVGAIIATGGLAGTAGLGSAGVSAVTTGVTGLSSMGTNIGEAYDSGATGGEALIYGLTTGAIEAGTELLTGGLGKGVKALGLSRGIGGLDDIFAKKLAGKVTKSITNEAVQKVAGNTIEYVVKAGGEGAEEVLSGLGSAVMKKLTYMSDEDLGKLIEDENLLEQFVTGAIVSSIAQTPSYIHANKTGTDFVTGQTLKQERATDALAEMVIAQKEASGTKLTTVEKNKIYNDVTSTVTSALERAPDTLEQAAWEAVARRNKTNGIDLLEARRRGEVNGEVLDRLTGYDVEITADEVRKVTGFGEEGAKLVANLSNQEGATFVKMMAEVKKSYAAGFQHPDLDIKKAENAFVSKAQADAFTAGQMDRQMQDLAAKERFKNAVVNMKSGFLAKNLPSDVTESQVEILNLMAEGLGVKSYVAKGLKGNAEYNRQTGEVPIDFDFEREIGADGNRQKVSIVFHAAHEMALHRVVDLAPEEGSAFVYAMYNHLAGNEPSIFTLADEKRNAYAAQDVEISLAEAMEELSANNILYLYNNDEARFHDAIDRIVNGTDEKAKQGLRKYVDFLKNIIKKISDFLTGKSGKERAEGQAELDEITKLRDMFETAFAKAVENKKAIQARSTETKTSKNLEIKAKEDYNYNVSHSLKWRTDLNARQYRMVENWIRQVDNHEPYRIADTDGCWYKGRIDGEALFAIYSTATPGNPTILYERKGDGGSFELDILMGLLEEIENGKSVNGKSAYVNWVSRGGWMRIVNSSQNNTGNLGGGGHNQNARVLPGQSQRNGSPAFWNVIENLRRTEQKRYSLKENEGTALTEAQEKNDKNLDLTDNDLTEYVNTGKTLHTRNKKQRMLESGKKPILTSDDEIKKFIFDVIRGKAPGEVRAFKKVGKRLADAIRNKRNSLQMLDKYLELNADDLREAYKRHSSPKEQGDIPLSEQDFERIPEYLDEFDGVLSVNTYNNKVEVHLYKKTEDGYIRILTVVSSERNSLQVTKLIGVSKEKFEQKYAKKIEGDIGSLWSLKEDSAPSTTAQHTADVPSTINISPLKEKVKSFSDFSVKEKNSLKGTIVKGELAPLVKKYGAIPAGEKPHRVVQVPKKTADNKKVSQTVRTILEAKATPDEALPTIEKMVEDGIFSYEAYSDKKAIKDAEKHLKGNGWTQSFTEWMRDVERGIVSKQHTVMGWALYNNAVNTAAEAISETERKTAMETALSVLDGMVRHQRSAAQALQATRILKSLSPKTQLYGVQKSVQAFQKELIDKYKDKAPKLKIDEKLAEQFLKAKTEDERLEAETEIYKDIGRQMPSTLADKWNAWRYVAMLANLRTHGRNILGNAFFAPVVLTKDLIATGIESVVASSYAKHGKTMLRGKAIVFGSETDKALLKAAWDDYANVADIVSGEGKYGDNAIRNKAIEEGRTIFTGWLKPAELVRRKNSKALEKEDGWFSKPHYAYALAQYCKANNITAEQIKRGKAIAPAREYAIKEAQKATYRDTNAFSQMISDLGRNHRTEKNIAKKAFNTVTEGVLPFRKTPANILVRGVEYSPIGLLKSLTYDLKQVQKGEMQAYEAIDNISAGLTGTGLLALGVLLAAQGLVRGHGEKEKEEKEFKELMGHQSYALELPNGASVTLDWLAPEALPFFVGVNLWESTKGSEEKVNLSTILQSVSHISEPMLEMSCLQSLNDVFKSVGYASSNDTSALVAVVSSAATSYLTQGIPTFFGQIERTGEEYRMATYAGKNDFLTSDMQYALGKVSAKIPFWDYHQIPYIDAWGRKEASGTALKRGFNNFLNPAYTSTARESKMEKELLRLYEKTGEKSVFPKRADKYFTVDEKRKDLTAEEYVRYATLKGEKSHKAVTSLVNSSAYKKLSDAEKVKAIADAYDYANQKAKKAVSASYKTENWTSTADEFGTNVGSFLAYRAEVSSTRKENADKISKQQVAGIVLDMAQNGSDAWKMYLSTYEESDGTKYARDNGVDGKTYMHFLEALKNVDEPTKSGKYGTYTQDEAREAVELLEGLSYEEKAALWQSVNTTWKKNPYR